MSSAVVPLYIVYSQKNQYAKEKKTKRKIHKNKYSVSYKQPVTSKFHVKNKNNIIIIKEKKILSSSISYQNSQGVSWMDEERGRGGSGPEARWGWV